MEVTFKVKVRIRKVNVSDYFSWRSGFLSLEDSSLLEVMTQLSRYYKFKFTIQNEDLANQTFSGKLDLKNDVNETIQVLRETTNFDFQIIDDRIIIN